MNKKFSGAPGEFFLLSFSDYNLLIFRTYLTVNLRFRMTSVVNYLKQMDFQKLEILTNENLKLFIYFQYNRLFSI